MTRTSGDVFKSSGLLDKTSSLVVAAHELKTPLSLVRQLALSLDEGSISGVERKNAIDNMVLICDRALRLTGDITKQTKLDQVEFEFEPVNPVEICEDVVHELEPLYSAINSEVIVKKRRKSPLVIANRGLLRRVLLNFGDNALHYASGRSISFSISTIGKYVQINVRDVGPVVSNISNSANYNISGRPESSGIGLDISRMFARIMRGDIGSIKHKDGMTFYVSLEMSTQLSLL